MSGFDTQYAEKCIIIIRYARDFFAGQLQ